jgi:hypothetical protein
LDAWGGTPELVVCGAWPALDAALAQRSLAATARSPQDVAHAAICGMANLARSAYPARFANELPPPRYLRLATAEERLAQRSAGAPG